MENTKEKIYQKQVFYKDIVGKWHIDTFMCNQDLREKELIKFWIQGLPESHLVVKQVMVNNGYWYNIKGKPLDTLRGKHIRTWDELSCSNAELLEALKLIAENPFTEDYMRQRTLEELQEIAKQTIKNAEP